jgi:acyl-CoA dehydrogenase
VVEAHAMDFAPSAQALAVLERVRAFTRSELALHEAELLAFYRDEAARAHAQAGQGLPGWRVHPRMADWKAEAKRAGLFNLFLPRESQARLSLVDYAPIAEELGRYLFASEVFNCSAPDTGNMELLHLFGTPWQKEQFLAPALAGEVRSGFAMTEPDVASSDATGMQATIQEVTLPDGGPGLRLQGRKWWTTGLGHPNCAFLIFMGVSNPEGPRHARHSMVLVPRDAPGVRVLRMLSVFGDFDAPAGHGEVLFDNVEVPRAHLIGELGSGFALAQGRLGPGRVHHCMRAIGAAERMIEMYVARSQARSAFGKLLLDLGGNRATLAELRLAVDQARLLTLHAAWSIDTHGVKASMQAISSIKAVVPKMMEQVVNACMQIHGAYGLGPDSPLPAFYTIARALRLADGPDEVHLAQVAKMEVEKHKAT